jgi:ribosomal-protein-alanine acetyltransferase
MSFKYRPAKISDLDLLESLEKTCFDTDRLNKRRFLYFITKSHGDFILIEYKKTIVGYGLVLYHQTTSLARLYSIAIHPDFRGKKLAHSLLDKLIKASLVKECSYMRLEVKESNRPAISFYEKLGFRRFGHKKDYYEDHQNALLYEKKIKKIEKKQRHTVVPFYLQSTEFTCGPASLMMAMKALNKKLKFSREEEIQLWREATTIYMTRGHGGCGPHGMALAAKKRGFGVELYLNSKSTLFVEGVRTPKKKEIITLVQNQFERKLRKTKIKVHNQSFSWAHVENILKHQGIPLILISSYRLVQTKAPHWVVITGIEDQFIYFHDPEISKGQTAFDVIDIPVRKDEFEKMARFGKQPLKCLLAIYAPNKRKKRKQKLKQKNKKSKLIKRTKS